MKKGINYWIEKLGLEQHPEGGYFRETYRSDEIISENALPSRFNGLRSFSTAIYFLLPGKSISLLHRIKSDEIWHFYCGASLSLHIIEENGRYSKKILGDRIDKNENFQVTIKANSWFGASVNDPASYTLAGCTVAPGFDFNDFEIGNREELLGLFPEHSSIIEKLAMK